jgi:hypothetical protein
MERLPKNKPYILLGDLNANLRYPRDDRAVAVAATVSSFGLIDMLGHFRQQDKFRHGMPWKMQQRERIIMSRCDYILSTDRRIFSNVTIREPIHYTTDHYMILGILLSEPMKAHRSYINGRKRYPLHPHKWGPKTKTDALFEDLKGSIKQNPKRDRVWTPWISKKTWALVDKKEALKKSTRSSPREDKRLTRQIHRAIRADRKKRTHDVRQLIEVLLGQHNLCGAWRTLKVWYRHASGRTNKPSRVDLAELQTEYGELFANQPSTGDQIPVLVSPFEVNDMNPTDKETGAALGRLHSRNSPGPSGMRPEDLKEWWDTASRDKDPDTKEWDKLVELVQHIFETGNLPL